MTRRILICLLALVMVTHTTGCTSGGSSDDTEVAESNDETFAEEGEGDFADDSTEVAEDTTTDESVTDSVEDSGAVADAAPAEDSADDLSLDGEDTSVADSAAPTDETTPSDVAANDDLSLDDPGALPEDAPADVPSDVASNDPENITDNPASPSDAGVFTDPQDSGQASLDTPAPDVAAVDTTPSAPSSDFSDSSPPPAEPSAPVASAPAVYAPYLKVKDSAFTASNGDTLNRVYLARPKDTAKSIATKVYGDASRSKDLVKWNPIMKRGVRTGDKIYYQSASNASDSRMMTYYEEAGVQPQTYVAKDNDNFRSTAQSLLGFKDAWKEVYATNANLSEKSGRIPTGLELRYWGDQAAPSVPVTTAQTETPAVPPVDNSMNGGMPSTLPDAAPQVPPTDVATNEMPPSDPFAQNPPPVAQNNNGAPAGADPLAPPPPMPDDAMAQNTAGTTDPMAPPPVPPSENVAPTPAAPKPVVKRAAAPEPEETMDQDTVMVLGVGGVLLLAAALLFVVIRKKRATRMDLGQTQV